MYVHEGVLQAPHTQSGADCYWSIDEETSSITICLAFLTVVQLESLSALCMPYRKPDATWQVVAKAVAIGLGQWLQQKHVINFIMHLADGYSIRLEYVYGKPELQEIAETVVEFFASQAQLKCEELV